MRPRVLTMGTFDLFHVGHLELLKACSTLCHPDPTVHVGVNTDDFVAAFKGHHPIVPLDERMALVGSCRWVDTVQPNPGGAGQVALIESVRPRYIAVGDDWKDRDYLGQIGVTQAWLDERGIRVVYVPRTTGVSSSALRERAAAR
jgi:glycerol-3-phosphate cytidylyltransferase